MLDAGNSAHRGLNGEGHELLDFFRAHTARFGVDRHLVGGDVRDGIKRKLLPRDQPKDDHQSGRDDNEKPLFEAEL